VEDTTQPPHTTLKVGEGAKGGKVYTPPCEMLTYSKEKGSGVCYYPLTVFCPKCSRTHEYNSKFREWRQKWIIEEDDYSFTIIYALDESGETYPKCSKCDFDLRKDYVYGVQEPEAKIIKEEYNVSVFSAAYDNGFFIISLDEFKRGVREAYTKKGNLLITINNSTYKLDWSVYSNPQNIISKDGKVFFKRTLWSQA
jgi:hypothetical protein